MKLAIAPARPAAVTAGAAVSEMLDYVPASFRVLRHVQPRLVCKGCDTEMTAAMPSAPIERGKPSPGLIAHVLTAKYCDHLPLYRQSEIDAREGIDLARSTPANIYCERQALTIWPTGSARPAPCWRR